MWDPSITTVENPRLLKKKDIPDVMQDAEGSPDAAVDLAEKDWGGGARVHLEQ